MTDKESVEILLSRHDPALDMSAFVQLLSNTTNSYKYLFLLALINRIGQTPVNQSIKIPLTDMALDMAALAWYPCRYFRLNFGSQDQLPQLLSDIGGDVSTAKHGKEFLRKIRLEIQGKVDVELLASALLRYVPFRLLRPFFANQLENASDWQLESLIPELSRSAQDSLSPALYALCGPGNQPKNLVLHLHPRWQSTLLHWHRIVFGWVLHEWAKFLQAKNPAMPNILAKLLPPDQRANTQFRYFKKFWANLLEQKSLPCPYTNERLKSDMFALDHFLPWSYVGHDLPWNLVPTIPMVNSSKGSKLPSEKYVDALASLHHRALTYSHKSMTEKKWSIITEAYCQDLRLDTRGLLSHDSLCHAYQQTMIPQISLGKQLGFEAGWSIEP